MDKIRSGYNAAYLLKVLSNRGFVQDEAEFTRVVFTEYYEHAFPIYLKFIVCVGAFIAAFFLIGFLALAGIISYNSTPAMVVWSIVFMGAAIAIWKTAVMNNKHKHIFLVPFSFALMVAGKLLFVAAMIRYFNSIWSIPFGWFLVTAITYPIYTMSTDRFFSSFFFLNALFASITWNFYFINARELILNAVLLFEFAGAAILWMQPQYNRDHIPLAYAFVCALCSSVLFFSESNYFGYKEISYTIFFINALLTGGLIALFTWAAGGLQKLKTEPLMLASIATVLLGVVSVGGVLLAIALLVLGYAKHEKGLVFLGGLLTPIFLFLYYYNLDVSLLQKSLILLESGAILLVSRMYLHYKGWDKGAMSCEQK